MTLTHSLHWRYATKQFDPNKKISDQDFSELLESLQMSPSSFGLQPWKFIIVTNPNIRQQLKTASWNQTQVTDASHLIVFARQTDMTDAHISAFIGEIAKTRHTSLESLESYQQMMVSFITKLSPEKRAAWMERQVYIALGFLLLSAATKQIDACPMEGFDPAQYDEILDLHSKGLTSVVVCPVGYRSQDDKYASEAKVRYPLSQLIIQEK